MKKALLILVGVLLIISIAISVSFNRSKEEPKNIYKKKDSDAPKVKVDKAHADLGKLVSNQVKNHTFKLKNVGKKDLVLSNPKTSCGCTSVVVVIDGASSPIFSMHENKNWQGKIKPGATADVLVAYNPAVHEIKEKTTREILINTNDPEKQNLILKITVEP